MSGQTSPGGEDLLDLILVEPDVIQDPGELGFVALGPIRGRRAANRPPGVAPVVGTTSRASDVPPLMCTHLRGQRTSWPISSPVAHGVTIGRTRRSGHAGEALPLQFHIAGPHRSVGSFSRRPRPRGLRRLEPKAGQCRQPHGRPSYACEQARSTAWTCRSRTRSCTGGAAQVGGSAPAIADVAEPDR
jgi:hypothetical protein